MPLKTPYENWPEKHQGRQRRVAIYGLFRIYYDCNAESRYENRDILCVAVDQSADAKQERKLVESLDAILGCNGVSYDDLINNAPEDKISDE